MYQLYRATPQRAMGGITVPHWDRLQSRLQQAVDRVVDYYRTTAHRVDASHPLVRLLDNSPISRTLPLAVYQDRAHDLTQGVANGLGMSSLIHQGRVHTPGWFYGRRVTEIVIAVAEPYDIRQLETNWRHMRPIRVIQHPHSDLSLSIPNGTDTQTTGTAVVVVNVPMLLTQYRLWGEQEQHLGQSSRTSTQFLMQYPIPNMLYSQTDLAICNRLQALWRGETPDPYRRLHAFWQNDWSVEVDRALQYWLEYIQTRSDWTWDDILSAMPTVFSNDIHKVIREPDVGYSRQLQWTHVVAYTPLTAWLLQMTRRLDNPANRSYLSKLRIYLTRIQADSLLQTTLPNHARSVLQTQLETEIIPYL